MKKKKRERSETAMMATDAAFYSCSPPFSASGESRSIMLCERPVGCAKPRRINGGSGKLAVTRRAPFARDSESNIAISESSIHRPAFGKEDRY